MLNMHCLALVRLAHSITHCGKEILTLKLRIHRQNGRIPLRAESLLRIPMTTTYIPSYI